MAHVAELKAFESGDGYDEMPSEHSRKTRDDLELTRLGKKPVLKVCKCISTYIFCIDELQRYFGFLSMLGFSCTVMITWEGVLM